jgi:TATA-box binding protein (TBP) (component of TFIID and TFIIIB)
MLLNPMFQSLMSAAAAAVPQLASAHTLVPKVEEDAEEASKEESPEVDIVINNVVCSFSVRCHLNLKEIALNGSNVEYRRENGMVTMKLRHPYTTASIWSSGKITCTGANSEDQARVSARKFSRILQKLDDKYKDIRIKNWRIVNVLGTCTLPFAIKITPFSQAFREASYEPELHPGVTYKIKYPKATLKIFSTGSITVTAPSVANVEAAIKHLPQSLRLSEEKGTAGHKETHPRNQLSQEEVCATQWVQDQEAKH